MLYFLYQRKVLLKIIEFSLMRQLNDLNRTNLYFGHVAEWLRRGLQIPYSNRLFPYKQYNKVTLQPLVHSVGNSWESRLKKLHLYIEGIMAE